MFIKNRSGEVFNVLLKGESGSWVIAYDNPSAPMYVDKDEIDGCERIEPPKEYVASKEKELSEAAKSRIDMIRPLLDDERCITDARIRSELSKRIAEESGASEKRVLRLYYTYFATGGVLKDKPRERKKNPVFDLAIKKYYFSAKKNSLKTSYELMLLESFTDEKGEIRESIPSYGAFRQYYYKHWNDSEQKKISRNGLSFYKRNERMLYGSAMAFRDSIGSYQIDETIGDIYLVSSYDRSKVLGRPNIYLAIDTVTQLITGIYVGFATGEVAIMSCIANSATNKVEYCKQYDLDIALEDWPSIGLPSELITDRGKEFIGQRAEELCIRYGVDINTAPPFRAEQKPLVERSMSFIQESYKSMLQGKGIINSDANERWGTDYRSQACLTLEEYTRMLIICILTLNKSRVLDNLGHLPEGTPNTPLALWNWFVNQGKSTLLSVDENELYIRSLPRSTTVVTRTGISFNSLRYIPVQGESLTINTSVKFAYDEQNVKYIYVIKEDGSFLKCHLSEASFRYRDYTTKDIALMKADEREDKNKAREAEVAFKVEMRKQILEIVENAKRESAYV